MYIDLERIQKDEVKLSDDISKLETEKEKVAKKIELIDQTLQEFSDKIVELEKPIENRNDEQAKNKYDMRKPCKFNNRGYCSQKERCQFFHAVALIHTSAHRRTCSTLALAVSRGSGTNAATPSRRQTGPIDGYMVPRSEL